MKKHYSTRNAFTLIEIIVAIGLFSILFAIASGGFVSALRAERQTAVLLSAESNVGIALEKMAREIRTGYLFCHSIDPNGNGIEDESAVCSCTFDAGSHNWTCPELEYYNSNGEKVDYTESGGILQRTDSAENGGAPQAITGDNVNVRSLSFVLFGNKQADHWNPRITIAVSIAPNDSTISWDAVDLQTTVSAREIDCAATGPNPC